MNMPARTSIVVVEDGYRSQKRSIAEYGKAEVNVKY